MDNIYLGIPPLGDRDVLFPFPLVGSNGVPLPCPPFCILFPLRMGSSYKGGCERPLPLI